MPGATYLRTYQQSPGCLTRGEPAERATRASCGTDLRDTHRASYESCGTYLRHTRACRSLEVNVTQIEQEDLHLTLYHSRQYQNTRP